MNIYQTILFVTLAGTVGSAPLSQKLDIMDKDTVEQAHSFISKILADIPTTHAAWINYKSLTLDQPSSDLQFLKNSTIPAAPQLKSISDNFTLEMCLARIVDGLNLHLNLLKVISKAPTMNQTKEVPELQAEIQDLLYLIFELQDQAGYEQAMDNQLQTLKHSLAEPLKDEFMTKMMAHLTLQQLQVFSWRRAAQYPQYPQQHLQHASLRDPLTLCSNAEPQQADERSRPATSDKSFFYLME